MTTCVDKHMGEALLLLIIIIIIIITVTLAAEEATLEMLFVCRPVMTTLL